MGTAYARQPAACTTELPGLLDGLACSQLDGRSAVTAILLDKLADAAGVRHRDNSGAIRLFYSTYRRYRNTGTSQHQFKWSNLPAKFAWKHWQFDHTKLGDMRPTLVGSGDQTNLPLGTSMGVCGVGLIEIVPA